MNHPTRLNRFHPARLPSYLATIASLAAWLVVTCALLCGGCRSTSPFDYDAVNDDGMWDPADHRPDPRDRVGDVPDRLTFRPQEPSLDPDARFDSPLTLTIEDAVILTLRNNRGLRVQQLQPIIAGTFIELERARFDPLLEADLLYERDRVRQVSPATQDIFDTVGEDTSGRLGILQPLPTGTEIGLSLQPRQTDSDRVAELFQARIGLTVTQALLQGRSWKANVASIEQAQLDTVASQYQLRGFAQALVANVETFFWEYLFAQREI
jgi:hypothetical protein